MHVRESPILWPAGAPYGNLQATLFDQGKFAAQDSIATEMRRQFPNVPGQALNALPRLYHEGKFDSMRVLIQRERASSDAQARLAAVGAQSDLAAVHGRLRESERLRVEQRKLLDARGVPAIPIYDSLSRAAVDILIREQPQSGIRRIEEALATTPLTSIEVERRPYFDLIALNAMAGRPNEARAMLARYDAEVSDSAVRRMREPGRHTMLGLIALAENRPHDALTELRLGESYPDGPAGDCPICIDPALGMAHEMAGAPDSAIVAYEHFVRTPLWARHARSLDGTWLAFTLRRLGVLYEERGDLGKASETYTRFLALWKDADPDLQPRVAEVRRRLEGLRVREQ